MINRRIQQALVRSATTSRLCSSMIRGSTARPMVVARTQEPFLLLNSQSTTNARNYHASAATSSGAGDFHGTTILCVRKNGQVCMMGDGMVSQGSMIMKPNAVKIRQILHKGGSGNGGGSDASDDEGDKSDPTVAEQNATLVGFAGTTADAFTLLERLEGKLDEYPGQLSRSCVELAKGWRMDKYLRRLEAALIVADENVTLEITGNGDVIESHDGVISVGSGSPYATGTCVEKRELICLV